ncbi:MAG: YHS domain-containing (seleno)protein [Aquabacterium sp.]|nr:YHS domain-containing (seleno)protein [Aquabacterium sp.]
MTPTLTHPGALWRRLTLALFAALALALSGCSAMRAQNPDSPLKPVRAIAMDGDAHVMLDGHDVVAYFTLGRHALGQPQIKSVYQGVTFRFASAEHKALFDAAPTRYLPQYGGFCANGIVYGIPWGGDADTWRIIDGKLYIFGGAGSRDAFELDIPGNLKLSQQYWTDEVAGSNSFWQRSKRMVLRVPHYKSGSELAKLVADAKARKP